MSTREWSPDVLRYVRSMRERGQSWPEIGAHYGCSGNAARKAYKRGEYLLDAPAQEPVKAEFDRGQSVTTVEANRPFTQEELAEIFQLDLDEWVCTKYLTNTWGNNWQSKAWWAPVQLNMVALHWDELVEDADNVAEIHGTTSPPEDGLMYEINISDAHIGALSWGPEAGEDYDTDIGLRMYNEALADLISRAPDGLARVLLVVGNDLFHFDDLINGSGGATTKGTPQDVDTRWQKLFVNVCHNIEYAVRRIYEDLGVPVDVIVVPGNHDTRVCYYLGEWLSATFRDHEFVRVDNSPRTRKYYRWGDCTVGLTHGDKAKPQDLYGLMTEEAGVSTFREWHLGHEHQEMMKEWGTVRIRWLPALFPGDAWHNEQGYRSMPGARAFVWHPTQGVRTVVAHNPVPKQRAKNTGPALD